MIFLKKQEMEVAEAKKEAMTSRQELRKFERYACSLSQFLDLEDIGKVESKYCMFCCHQTSNSRSGEQR